MRIATLVLIVIVFSPLAQAADWLTLPSRYSHNPSTGERVAQYTKIQAPSVPQPSNFRTSGYTHTRSSLNYGQSADNYHRVEQWGDRRFLTGPTALPTQMGGRLVPVGIWEEAITVPTDPRLTILIEALG